MILVKAIRYFGEPAAIACDGMCWKAWGINGRPQVQLSKDEDDYEYLADGELGVAPLDPGTYEGGEAKPTTLEGRLNKWCARECERSILMDAWELTTLPEALPDYTKRHRNMPHLHEPERVGGE